MQSKPCASCKFRERYENNPRSLLGRLWRWHTGWCPGWNIYMKSLSEEEQNTLRAHLAELDARRRA
ncbi:MAG: hypothetical protein BWY09_01655 [Candidatus Hydrogenedentes bacterium ADurb.Bin179]|mgnify:FL=1|nr:MAG: hypothetical protein BWY09_01655 [Candidatus Hydrogenedentes bacterium ADurb.Bin179]